MTEKTFLFINFFLSLNVSDFSLFLCKNCNPLEKSHRPLTQQPPLKIEVLSSPPIFENLVGGSTPTVERQGGAHYVRLNNSFSAVKDTSYQSKFIYY